MTSGGPKPPIPDFLHPIRSTERGYRRKVCILIIYGSDHPYGHPLRILIIMAKNNQVQVQNVILRPKRNYMYGLRSTLEILRIYIILPMDFCGGNFIFFTFELLTRKQNHCTQFEQPILNV